MKKTGTVLLIILMVLTIVTGCSKTQKETETQTETNPQTEAEAGLLTFKPSETGIPAKESYEYPYMGMTAKLTDMLREKLASRDAMLLSNEAYTEDGRISFAAMECYKLTEEQKNEEVSFFDPEEWKKGLQKIGVLGVYRTEDAESLLAANGCREHKELGKSADGSYTYYLSLADGVDEFLRKELAETTISISEMLPLDFYLGKTAFSEARVDTSGVGTFTATDINGKEYTEQLFKEYDLTLVNVFTTWCSPCVEEIPALEELRKNYKDKGVNVLGLVYNAVTETGETDEDAIDTAKRLQEKTGASFPFLIPDETKMNGRLQGIDSFPESFFVDKDGNIIGEPYLGGRTLEDWSQIVDDMLAGVKGENK